MKYKSFDLFSIALHRSIRVSRIFKSRHSPTCILHTHRDLLSWHKETLPITKIGCLPRHSLFFVCYTAQSRSSQADPSVHGPVFPQSSTKNTNICVVTKSEAIPCMGRYLQLQVTSAASMQDERVFSRYPNSSSSVS